MIIRTTPWPWLTPPSIVSIRKAASIIPSGSNTVRRSNPMSSKTDSPMSKMARLAGSQADAEIVRTTSAKGLAALREGLGLSTALAAVLALAAVILCHGLTEPFIGHHDWTSASMSAAARNHLRYGYTATRLAIIAHTDVLPPEL